jgi:putative nucleotidyltransferase with HDIG domain
VNEHPPRPRSAGRLRKWTAAWRKTRLGREILTEPWTMALIAACVLSALITPRLGLPLKHFRTGSFADSAIKAYRDFDVEDVTSTEKRRQEAASSVPPVFDFDAHAAERQVKKLDDAFAEMRTFLGVEDNADGGKTAPALPPRPALEEQEGRLLQALGVTLDRKTLDFLAKDGYSPAIAADIRDLLNYGLSHLTVSDRKSLPEQTAERLITLRELGAKKERPYGNLDQIVDMSRLQDQLEKRARQNIDDPPRRAVALAIASALTTPTLEYNMAASEERRAEARADVGPSIIHFRKNQLIVAEGQQITDDHLRILAAMQEGAGAAHTLTTFLAFTAMVFLMIAVVFRFANRYVRKFKPTMRDYAFLLTTAVFAGAMAWVAREVAPPLADSFGWMTRESIRYLFPVAAFGMLIRFLMYSEAALVWVGFASLAAGLIMDGSLAYAIYFLVGSAIGAHQIGQAQGSGRFLRAGLLVGVGNAAVALATQLIGDPASLATPATLVNLAAAALGGLLTGPFVLAAVHPLEAIFGYTSNLRLMELANLNHPLLGRMLVEAPGTYHHSLMVSALAEKGAESIGANPLLVKVAGLYHDIGKINKPHYFIENQIEGQNPHDGLPPHMSALILIGHVRDGQELARHHRLGERISQVIAEHHGRSRINYFYNRAKQQETAEREKVNEEEFRYRGPYPQSKEAALVMLADVVEAATRSLKQPTPARIETSVNELISNVYNDGQLDECEMTLRNLHGVAAQFTTLLTGRYHGRIEYPEKEQPKKGKIINLPASGSPNAGSNH